MKLSTLVQLATLVTLPCWAGTALAHGDQNHTRTQAAVVKEQKAWGIAGDAKDVQRTVTLRMGDDMRFSPDRIEVRQGQTLRLVVSNRGKVMHELVLGTRQELDEHAALMRKFPDMEHDEPYMSHVAPGKRGELVWLFNRAGDFEFACLIPGHYEAGMRGTIRVLAQGAGASKAQAEPAPQGHGQHKH